MDPIYQVGTSVSASVSFRSSETLQERRAETRSQNARNSRDSPSGDLSDRLTDIRDSVDVRTSETTESLLQYTGRVLEQADRIEQRIQSQVGSGGEQSSNTLTSKSGAQFSMSSELMSYLQMIRSLAPDKESFESFLDQMDAYLNGETGQDKTIEEYLGEVGEQFGFSSVRIQQEFNLEFNGQVVVRNGDRVTVFDSRMTERTQTQQTQEAEPLVFDLDGDGLELTTVEEGVSFDITGSGQKVQTAFVTGDDAFLALDRNENGTIDSGKELFGDQHGAKNGIEELRKFDDNHDGFIDESDEVFDRLQLFVDENGDGVSQSNELTSLKDRDIVRISLDAKEENRRIAGNRMAASTYYQSSSGSRNQIGEMYLNYFA